MVRMRAPSALRPDFFRRYFTPNESDILMPMGNEKSERPVMKSL